MTLYDMEESFQCLQCAEGCDECEDSAPCIVTLNVVLRWALIELFTITEKALLEPSILAFTFRTLLRHYAKWALTPRSLNVKLGHWCKDHNRHRNPISHLYNVGLNSVFEEMKNTLIHNCIGSHTNCFKSSVTTNFEKSLHNQITKNTRMMCT